MKKIIIASALLALSSVADAAVVQVELISHLFGRAGNPPSVSLINPDPSFAGDNGGIPMPTFWYDESTGELSSSGVAHFRIRTSPLPGGRHFDRFITDLNIVAGSAAGTAAYDCVDGGFSFAVGASFCGNYLWGADFINDSIVTYGPGLAFSRQILGDDVIAGAQQSILDYNMVVASYDGTSLVLESAEWTATGGHGGLQMNFAVIPVPAAAWFFGSALTLLLLRRRRTGSSS